MGAIFFFFFFVLSYLFLEEKHNYSQQRLLNIKTVIQTFVETLQGQKCKMVLFYVAFICTLSDILATIIHSKIIVYFLMR